MTERGRCGANIKLCCGGHENLDDISHKHCCCSEVRLIEKQDFFFFEILIR